MEPTESEDHRETNAVASSIKLSEDEEIARDDAENDADNGADGTVAKGGGGGMMRRMMMTPPLESRNTSSACIFESEEYTVLVNYLRDNCMKQLEVRRLRG